MPSRPTRLPLASPAEFADGLGVRTIIAQKNGEALELFRLRPEFCSHPDFELALRERVSRLANFRQAFFARVRRIEREAEGLGIVSEHAAGARLSHVLDVAERHGLDLDINAALCLMRQLVPAVATLHQNARDVSHGVLAPERILVTSHARIVVTEYVLGSAIEQLGYSRDRLWRELQVAAPPGAGAPHLDHRADVMQIGLVALALVRGRRMRDDDLRSAADLVVSATENALGRREPLSAPLRRWLMRALQLDPRAPFQSAADAQVGLDDVLSSDAGYVAAPVALESFLTRYQECVLLDEETDAAEDEGEPAKRTESSHPKKKDDKSGRAGASDHRPVEVKSAATASAAIVAQMAAAPTAAAPLPSSAGGPRVTDTPPARTAAASADPFDAHSPATTPAPAAAGSGSGGPHPQVAGAQAPAHFDRPLFVHAEERGSGNDTAAHRAGSGGLSRGQRWALVGAVGVAVLEAIFIVYMQWFSPSALLAGKRGTLSIESRPTAVPVVIDGEARGATPLTVTLSPGPHVMELTAGASTRVIPIAIEAGLRHAQYIELPSHTLTGALQVRGPAGLRVLVDGELRGTTPVTISDLAAGEHDLLFDGPHGQTRQKVTIQAGATSAITPGGEATLLGSGWASFDVPYEMQVFENGQLLGTTAGDRLTLTAGRHALEIVSETLAFRVTRTVTVNAGEVTRVPVQLPTGLVTVTSDPVAEVWLEGQKIGSTPLERFPLPIGPHELVLKHPELGERHEVLSVTAGTPVTLNVLLRR